MSSRRQEWPTAPAPTSTSGLYSCVRCGELAVKVITLTSRGNGRVLMSGPLCQGCVDVERRIAHTGDGVALATFGPLPDAAG